MTSLLEISPSPPVAHSPTIVSLLFKNENVNLIELNSSL